MYLIDAARQLVDTYGQNYAHIYLATDDPHVINETSNFPQFKWHFSRFDRAAVGGRSGVNIGGLPSSDGTVANFIEERAQYDEALRSSAIESALADLRMLAQCQLFVGTSMSQYSRLAFALMHARHGVVPPFIFLDAPLCTRGRPSWTSKGERSAVMQTRGGDTCASVPQGCDSCPLP